MIKATREAIKTLKKAGLKVSAPTPTGSSHMRVEIENKRGDKSFYIISTSPGDRRRLKQMASDARHFARTGSTRKGN